MTGNTANNTLNGGIGQDTMIGGSGDDIYIIDNVNDIIQENHSEGNDTVNSSVSFGLSDNVENLILTGSDNINARELFRQYYHWQHCKQYS